MRAFDWIDTMCYLERRCVLLLLVYCGCWFLWSFIFLSFSSFRSHCWDRLPLEFEWLLSHCHCYFIDVFCVDLSMLNLTSIFICYSLNSLSDWQRSSCFSHIHTQTFTRPTTMSCNRSIALFFSLFSFFSSFKWSISSMLKQWKLFMDPWHGTHLRNRFMHFYNVLPFTFINTMKRGANTHTHSRSCKH